MALPMKKNIEQDTQTAESSRNVYSTIDEFFVDEEAEHVVPSTSSTFKEEGGTESSTAESSRNVYSTIDEFFVDEEAEHVVPFTSSTFKEESGTESSTVESVGSCLSPGDDSDSNSITANPWPCQSDTSPSTSCTATATVAGANHTDACKNTTNSARRDRAWALLLGFLLVGTVAAVIHVLVRAHVSSPVVRGGSRFISLSQLQEHNTPDDCWLLIHGKVYDVSDYDHPSGRHFITPFCGIDATAAFDNFHVKPLLTMLATCQVGVWSPQEHPSSPTQPSAKELQYISSAEMIQHNDADSDCWTSIDGNVYNMTNTDFLPPDVARSYCGKDVSAFFALYPSDQVDVYFAGHLVGFLLDDKHLLSGGEPTTGATIGLAGLALHDDAETDCWVAINGTVYDMTEYAQIHAGGASSITTHCGADATQAYDVFHDRNLLETVFPFIVGAYAAEAGTMAATTEQPARLSEAKLWRITLQELMQHNMSSTDCWTSVSGHVYNLTNVIVLPNSGDDPVCGVDASASFASHSPQEMERILGVYRIGVLWTPRTIAAAELALHDNANDCWVVLRKAVYDMTDYALLHPPGPLGIQAFCGADATVAFREFHELELLNHEAGPYTLGSIDNETIDERAASTPLVVTIPYSELLLHNDPETDCWVAFDGTVYDMTVFSKSHPGGARVITSFCGVDGSAAFHSFHGTGLLRRKATEYRLGAYDDTASVDSETGAPTKKIPHNELVLHDDAATDCWVVLHETVYNMTSYLQLHPAGDRFIAHFCGDDGTIAFGAYHDIGLLLNSRALQHRLGTYVDSA